MPTNDEPPGTLIGSLPFADTADTTRTAIHAMEPSLTCGSGSNSVWYAYAPDSDGIVVIDTAGSEYDTLVDVWTGTLMEDRMAPGFERLQPLACNDNTADSQQARVVLDAKAGEQYVIRVMAAFDSPAGILRLQVASD